MNERDYNYNRMRRQIAVVIISVITAAFLVLLLANNLFLSSFYTAEKEKSLMKAFKIFDKAAAEGKLYTESYAYTLENLCANQNLGVIAMTADGSIVLSSQHQSKTMMRQLYDIMLGENDSDSLEIAQTDQYAIRRGDDPQTDNEYLLLWGNLSDGNIILIRTAIAGIRDSSEVSNRFLIYVGIVTVVLAIIAAELIARRLTRSLRQLARENAILESDILESQKNEQMRREFLSNVSHELKTPIALIQGYAEGLKEGVGEDDAAFYEDVIIDEAKKMNTLVQKLLSLNRLEYGSSQAQNERFDINELIDGVISSNSILAKERGVIISFDRPEKSTDIWADPLLSEQVVTNYVTNAIHYCKGDPGMITIRLKPEGEGLVRLSVYNSGDPIDEEKLPYIWEKFYKVDPARTREYGGSGIGLSIVRAVADEMKGDCGVINYENGVEFWFDFHFFVEDLIE